MSTDPFTTAARAEAETQSEAAAAIVKPKKTDIAFARGVKAGVLHGAEWARTYLAEQEPTDDAVCDLIEDRMCDAMFTACVQEPDGEMTTYVDAPLTEVLRIVCDALTAARAARRDEEDR